MKDLLLEVQCQGRKKTASYSSRLTPCQPGLQWLGLNEIAVMTKHVWEKTPGHISSGCYAVKSLYIKQHDWICKVKEKRMGCCEIALHNGQQMAAYSRSQPSERFVFAHCRPNHSLGCGWLIQQAAWWKLSKYMLLRDKVLIKTNTKEYDVRPVVIGAWHLASNQKLVSDPGLTKSVC